MTQRIVVKTLTEALDTAWELTGPRCLAGLPFEDVPIYHGNDFSKVVGRRVTIEDRVTEIVVE